MTAITRDGIAKLYVATFNRAADSDGLNYWDGTGNIDGLVTSFTSMEEVASAFLTSAEAGVDLSEDRAAVVAALYENVLGREGNDSEINYWTNVSLTPTNELVLAFTQGALGPDNDYLNNKAEVASAFADAGLTDVAQAYSIMNAITADDATVTAAIASINEAAGIVAPVTDDTHYLTVGQDILVGNAGNDLFIARGNSSLDNADILDGGAGTDTVEVMLDNQETAESPLLKNIEILKVQGQDENAATGDNQTVGAADIDAGDMIGVEQFWSEDSRSDVVIEGIERNSSDTTIGFRKSDSGDVDYTALFYHPTDLGTVEDGATLTLDLVNVQALTDGGGALDDNQYLGFKFTLDGVEYEISTADFSAATTYADLAAVINTELAVLGLDTLKATLGVTTNVFNSDTSALVGEKTSIVIENSASGILAFNAVDAWISSPDAPAIDNVAAKMSNEAPDVEETLTQVNVALDYVGHGSPSGDLLIGNMSDGTTHAGSDGIQQFNVTVDRDSSLRTMSTTANGLEVVNLVNVADNNAAGDGDIAIGYTGTNNGLVDVQNLNAAAMVGEVAITASLTDAVTGKYFTLTDDATSETADNVTFNYDLGTANDTLNLSISDGNLLAAGSTTREDFVLDVTGGTGDDSITTTIATGTVAPTDAWYVNSTINANLSIDAGAGDDTITTTGAGNFVIDAGAGDDVVYANNDGNSAASIAVAEKQTITFGAAGDVISQGEVTITLSDGSTATTTGANSITTGDTAVQVATKVFAQTGVAIGANDTVAYNPGDDFITITYGAGYAGADDVALATVTGVLSDAEASVTATTAGVDGTDNVDAKAGTLVISSAGASTDTQTVTVTDGNGVTDTITLSDTDGNGVVSAVEFATQVADFTFTDYTVTASNATLGEVYLTGKVAEVTTAAVGGTGDATLAVTGTTNAGVTITSADGTAATAFSAGTVEVQTLTVSNGADQAGTVTMQIDTDADNIMQADETFTFNVTAGNEAHVAAELAAQINALSGVSAAQGAAGATIDDVIITWDAKVAADVDAKQNAAATTFVDGAVRSASVVETVKGAAASTGDAATWVVNAANTDTTDLISNVNAADALIYGSTLTVTYSGGAFSNSGVTNDVAVALSNGFESTVKIGTEANLGGQAQVNQAIKDAINNDAVLSTLLSATDGPADTLVITSLVDGQVVADDLAIDIAAPTTLSVAELASLNASYKDFINDSSAADLTSAQMITYLGTQITALDAANSTMTLAQDGGVDLAGRTSTSVSDNTITLGSGDDMVVLGSDANSNDTLVFAGTFGNDTVFNFVEAAGTATDTLDFSAYLASFVSLTGSTTSQTANATTGFDGASTLVASSVVTLNNFAGTATESWNSLSASDLLAAIKDDASATTDYANLSDTTLDYAATANLMGTIGNSIVMVENDKNDGEYKVFNVTASETTAEFTGATLVGTIDFGDSIDGAAVSLA